MYIIAEACDIKSIPKNIKKRKNKIQFECVLQTVDVKNRNKRVYPRSVLEESISQVKDRIKKGALLGELDHPIDSNPARQCTVWYKEASHRIMEVGWDGNKLVGVLESLRTPNGYILKNLAEDGIPIGFSYRGMGDLQKITESTGIVYQVKNPLRTITWDSVNNPSHEGAELIKITESTGGIIKESFILDTDEDVICENEGLICTSEGVCYLPNDFDMLVEKRIVNITNKYK